MSTEVLQRPDGCLDAWIHAPDPGQLLTPSSGSYGHYRTSSPVIGQKILDRPKYVMLPVAVPEIWLEILFQAISFY